MKSFPSDAQLKKCYSPPKFRSYGDLTQVTQTKNKGGNFDNPKKSMRT